MADVSVFSFSRSSDDEDFASDTDDRGNVKKRQEIGHDSFVLDNVGGNAAEFDTDGSLPCLFTSNEEKLGTRRVSTVDSLLDEETRKILSKSIIKPGYEKFLGEAHVPLTRRALKRKRKFERERTKGNAWYNLPAGEMTEERKRDLEIIQMRDSLDTKSHYRKNDRSALPKYFHIGTVIETKADFYSSRMPKKERRCTIVEELLADMDFQTKQRRKYQEIKAREAVTKRGSFRHSSYPKRKRKARPNRRT